MRVDAERDVVDEDAAIDCADIDPPHPLFGDDASGIREIERQPEIAGEVIEGAEREDVQRHIAAGERCGGAADAAVAPGDDGGKANRRSGRAPATAWPETATMAAVIPRASNAAAIRALTRSAPPSRSTLPPATFSTTKILPARPANTSTIPCHARRDRTLESRVRCGWCEFAARSRWTSRLYHRIAAARQRRARTLNREFAKGLSHAAVPLTPSAAFR
jgi:hypothetical protein